MGNNVLVIGLGNLGLPLAILANEVGYKVFGFDRDVEKIKMLESLDTKWLNEIRLEKLFKKHHKQITFLSDIEILNKIPDIIIVNIPLLYENNKIKYEVFNELIQSLVKIGRKIESPVTLIFQTTVPVGFTAIIQKKLEKSVGNKFLVVYSPERIKNGNYIKSLQKNNKLVASRSLRANYVAKHFFNDILLSLKSKASVIEIDNYETAEMAKLTENIFRDVNIALANELAWFALAKGVNFETVKELNNQLDECMVHTPGATVGGHCIPVYPYLYEHFEESNLIKSARKYNENQPRKIFDFIHDKSKNFQSSNVLILGLGYREGASTLKYSGVFELIRYFQEESYTVYVHDFIIKPREIINHDLTFYKGQKIDIVVTHTIHKKYEEMDSTKFGDPLLVFDAANTLRETHFLKSMFIRF